MIKEIKLQLSPKEASDIKYYGKYVEQEMNCPINKISEIKIIKRSIDARQKNIKINLSLLVAINEKISISPEIIYNKTDTNKEVVIIGSGPAGLFAALRLIEAGIKPIIYERGKDVKSRNKDLVELNKNRKINPDSNYCFGEGGAGTYSDGKLYTRSNKRGNVGKILRILHQHGAAENIMIDSQPHIGTNKLPPIIENIRNTIKKSGGEIHFNKRLTDFHIQNNEIKGIELTDTITKEKEQLSVQKLILASGHSARDIYELLDKKHVFLETKPFAVGVRVEHPQEQIDKIQYKAKRGKYLPAANYKIVQQVAGRGVYSFCMCPGGFIVPATTAENELVVNGMSPANRNSEFANSGIVVEVKREDFKTENVLSGIKFQQELEKSAFTNGGGNMSAPAQRLADFVNGKISADLPKCSFKHGIISAPLHFILPKNISSRLKEGFKKFDKKMRGFLTNDAVVVGVESRTSSPIRIPRNRDNFQHIRLKGLYPAGEGAGYAGGIVSAAIDGEKCAEAIIRYTELI